MNYCQNQCGACKLPSSIRRGIPQLACKTIVSDERDTDGVCCQQQLIENNKKCVHGVKIYLQFKIPKALTNRFDVWKKKVNMNVKSKIVKEELNRS
ncbi:hypothetical protein SDJN03_16279, partial [Cucurbita argyrosperma subsp. sororia]